MENTPLKIWMIWGYIPHYFRKMFQCYFLGKLVLETVLEAVLIGRDRKGDCFFVWWIIAELHAFRATLIGTRRTLGRPRKMPKILITKWNWLPLFHALYRRRQDYTLLSLGNSKLQIKATTCSRQALDLSWQVTIAQTPIVVQGNRSLQGGFHRWVFVCCRVSVRNKMCQLSIQPKAEGNEDHLYIYLEPQWPLFLKVNPPKTRPFPFKMRVIWVLGMSMYTCLILSAAHQDSLTTFSGNIWHDQIPPFAWIPPSRVQTSQRPPALNTANDCNTKTWNTSSSIIIRYDEILWDIRVWVWVSFWVTWIQHQLNTMSLSYYLIWFPLTHWSSIAVFAFIAFGSEFPTLNSIPAQFSVATQWSLHSSMFATPRGFGARVSWL